jgi:hypothetical protein
MMRFAGLTNRGQTHGTDVGANTSQIEAGALAMFAMARVSYWVCCFNTRKESIGPSPGP